MVVQLTAGGEWGSKPVTYPREGACLRQDHLTYYFAKVSGGAFLFIVPSTPVRSRTSFRHIAVALPLHYRYITVTLPLHHATHCLPLLCEGEWWIGSIGDSVGAFPRNYISSSRAASAASAASAEHRHNPPLQSTTL